MNIAKIVSVTAIIFMVQCSKPDTYIYHRILSKEDCKNNIAQIIRETSVYKNSINFLDVNVEDTFLKISYTENQRGFFDITSVVVPKNIFVYFNNVSSVDIYDKRGWFYVYVTSNNNSYTFDICTSDRDKAHVFADSIISMKPISR